MPAPILRWCGFHRREQVLPVAVPALSALVIHGQETLDRLLPYSEEMAAEAHPVDEGPVSRTLSSGASGSVGADGAPEVAGG